MAFAGLWSEWTDPETGELKNTFSIVTTEGNELLAKVHNNPRIKGPRMPLILPEELTDKWLEPIADDVDIKAVQELIRSYPAEAFEAYTVNRLRGKYYQGNVPEINKPVTYSELEF